MRVRCGTDDPETPMDGTVVLIFLLYIFAPGSRRPDRNLLPTAQSSPVSLCRSPPRYLMPRRASAVPAAAPAHAAVPEKHDLPKKPKPPKQVKDAAENERRAAVHAAALKDWEKQMEKHAALMATRKRAQKAASRPTDDSERRVRQRRDSQAQTDADTGGAAERRMTKRLEAQYARVQQLEDVELLDALRS